MLLALAATFLVVLVGVTAAEAAEYARRDNIPMALLGWSAASYHIRARDQWIGWNDNQRRSRLPLVASKAPDELLFTNTVGSQLSSSRFRTTTWTPALDAACESPPATVK